MTANIQLPQLADGVRTRIALIVRNDLELNVVTNAAVVLGLSLGTHVPHLLGADVPDASGRLHPGLVTHPVPVLIAERGAMRLLQAKAAAEARITSIWLTETAREARDYNSYASALAGTPLDEVDYVAVIMFGARNRVTALTKRLALLGSDR